LLVIANPLSVVFWSTLAASAAIEPGYQQLDFILGFFAIASLLSLLLVVVASQFKALLTPRGLLGISRLCGVVLIGLGLKLGLFLLELV
jgi:threonine/homoserine/homoserine lactone efflux protein